jgi:hypothetical protein
MNAAWFKDDGDTTDAKKFANYLSREQKQCCLETGRKDKQVCGNTGRN